MLPHLLLNVKTGGRDGLASGEPLRRRWRMAGNNGVLLKHLVLSNRWNIYAPTPTA